VLQDTDTDPWVQVDLIVVHAIAFIETRGRGNNDYIQYVTTYKISSSFDGQHCEWYEENGEINLSR
jgi:hypothetical protein